MITRFNIVQADQILGSQIESSPFGKIWYVDSTNGTDGNTGMTPSEAKSSIAGVHAVMKADRGDIAIFYPGTYTITTALSPKAFTTWKAAVVNSQDSTVIFSGNVNPLVDVEVDGVRFIGIEFYASETSAINLVKVSDTANVAGLLFEDCVFNGADRVGYASAPGTCGIMMKDGTYTAIGLVIRRCLFRDLGKTQMDIGVLGMPYALIEDNVFAIDSRGGIGVYMADTTAVTIGKGYIIRKNDFIGADSETTVSATGTGIVLAGTENVIAIGSIRNNYFANCASAAITPNKSPWGLINNYMGDSATGGTIVDSGS